MEEERKASTSMRGDGVEVGVDLFLSFSFSFFPFVVEEEGGCAARGAEEKEK